MIGLIVCLILSGVIFTPIIIFKNRIGFQKLELIAKIIAIILFALGVVRSFWNDAFVWVINGGVYGEIYYQQSDILQSLLRWGLMLSFVVYPCAIFFKGRPLRNISIYFCLPFAVFALFYYNDFISYFVKSSGRAIYVTEWIRHLELGLEFVLMIVFPLILRFCLGHKFNIKEPKEWWHFACVLICSLLVVIPVTLPQSLFGFTDMLMTPFSVQHIAWILLIFAIIIGLYWVFRFKSRETRLTLCVFLALYLFLHYNSIYLMDLNMKRLPFQLCNLGSYLVLIGLLVKKRSFFDFIFMANVPGAMIAFCVPDISEGMLSYWNIHFYIEHTWVFVIPILVIVLRIFDRPNKGAFKHFFIGFTCYFVFCLISGIIANGVLFTENHTFFNEVNYFYLFDTTVLEVLPFLAFTRKWQLWIGGYAFYPLYIMTIFVLYSIFCLAVFWIYKQLCKVGDDHFHVRSIKIDLYNERGRYAKRKSLPKKTYED